VQIHELLAMRFFNLSTCFRTPQTKIWPQTVRLAGLYDLERGPHSYWLKVGVVILDVSLGESCTFHLADANCQLYTYGAYAWTFVALHGMALHGTALYNNNNNNNIKNNNNNNSNNNK